MGGIDEDPEKHPLPGRELPPPPPLLPPPSAADLNAAADALRSDRARLRAAVAAEVILTSTGRALARIAARLAGDLGFPGADLARVALELALEEDKS